MAKGEEDRQPEDDAVAAERQTARKRRASSVGPALMSWLKGRSVLAVILAALGVGLGLLLLFTNFHPTRVVAWVTGPEGAIYVSSPGVYTRERLVNDRNDQDYWLRQQLKELDRSEFHYSARVRSERRFASGNTDDVEARPKLRQVAPDSEAEADVQADTPDEASVDTADKEAPVDSATLSFIDTFALRSAARDTLRQAVLENLLDDRHDLTGNSVYGLKFDTSIFPGQFTAGRAFVRLSITIDEADVIQRSRRDD